MAVTRNVQLKCAMSDGSTEIINLPAPVNMTLTDEDTGELICADVFDSIQSVFANDDGATVESITFNIVQVTTTIIAEDYHGD